MSQRQNIYNSVTEAENKLKPHIKNLWIQNTYKILLRETGKQLSVVVDSRRIMYNLLLGKGKISMLKTNLIPLTKNVFF